MKIENILCVRRSELHETGVTISRFKLSNLTAQVIREKYRPISLSNWTYKIKVEKSIKRGFIDTKAIRVFVPELMKEINSTIERGEKPYLLIKKAYSPKRKVIEFEMVFMGSTKDRHIEKLSYYTKPPEQWKSWGEIVFSPEQIEVLIKLLEDLLEAEDEEAEI